MHFLVTAANGDIGEAIGRILRERWPDAKLHGADIADPWPAQASFDVVHRLPSGNDPSYTTALAALAVTLGADVVIPVSEPELLKLATTPGSAARLPLVMAPATLVRLFLDKLETARWLASHGLPGPRTIPLAEAGADSLPLIVKPIRGHGARGYEVVRSVERLNVVKRETGAGYIAQALLEPADEEYTCAVVRLCGAVRTLVMRRQLDGSSTMRIEVSDQPEIQKLLARIADISELDGSINVQLRLTSEGPRIFEINPRISGTVMMRHRLGFQDLLWILAARAGAAPPAFVAPAGARVFRMAREIVAPPYPGQS